MQRFLTPIWLAERKKATTPLRDIPSSEANFSQVVTYAAALQNRGGSSGGNGRGAGGQGQAPGAPGGLSIVEVIEEEEWCLSEVIFLEDGRSQPVGRVLKTDGNIVAVRFMERVTKGTAPVATAAAASSGPGPTLTTSAPPPAVNPCAAAPPANTLSDSAPSPLGAGSSEGSAASAAPAGTAPNVAASPSAGPQPNDPSVALLADCRLLKRDDLVLVRNPASARSPEFYQRSPRRLPLPPSLFCSPAAPGAPVLEGTPPTCTTTPSGQHTVLAMTVTNAEIHLLVRSQSGGTGGLNAKLSYQVYSLFGKHMQSLRLMTYPPGFLGRSVDNVRLIGAGDVEVRPFFDFSCASLVNSRFPLFAFPLEANAPP